MSKRKENQYITFRNFCDYTVCEDVTRKREFPAGVKFFECHGVLFTNEGEPIVNVHSENGRHYFAYDGDGHGLERGELTYAIATAARSNRAGENFRLREYERDELLSKYPKYVQFASGFLFTDAFYLAPISDLWAIASYLGIKKEPIIINL